MKAPANNKSSKVPSKAKTCQLCAKHKGMLPLSALRGGDLQTILGCCKHAACGPCVEELKNSTDEIIECPCCLTPSCRADRQNWISNVNDIEKNPQDVKFFTLKRSRAAGCQEETCGPCRRGNISEENRTKMEFVQIMQYLDIFSACKIKQPEHMSVAAQRAFTLLRETGYMRKMPAIVMAEGGAAVFSSERNTYILHEDVRGALRSHGVDHVLENFTDAKYFL